MKISILAISQTDSAYLPLIAEYQKRISSVVNFELICLKEEKGKDEDKEKIIAKEQEKILKHIKPNAYKIILDKQGVQKSSLEFSRFLKQKIDDPRIKEIVFIIGGAFGFSQDFLKQADFVWSLSQLTFPHQLARLILLEQIYRACEIQKGSKYHK